MKIYSAHSRVIEFEQPAVMAIMNATPDSFSDGGLIDQNEQLQARIEDILHAGADIIDVGGESTRPGHEKVDDEEESQRVVRVITKIRETDQTVPISVDTQKATVAKTALTAGADFINDVSALSDPEMAEIIKNASCSVVLMRNRTLSEPVIESAKSQFEQIVQSAHEQGIDQEKIIVDPGLGFGDLASADFTSLPGADVVANLILIDQLSEYSQGLPVLIGASRKRFVGRLTGVDKASKRQPGSIALAVMAMQRGAQIVRVHDVAGTVQARDVLFQ